MSFDAIEEDFTFEDYEFFKPMRTFSVYESTCDRLYFDLLDGFFGREGEIPELAKDIASVWSKGVAEHHARVDATLLS